MKKYKLFLILGLIFLVSGCSSLIGINIEEKDTTKKEENNDIKDSPSLLVVPDVSGMTESDAKDILVLNGFKIGEIRLIATNDFEEGLVVKTEPSSGRKEEKDTLIDIYVSTSHTYVVEDFVGQNYLLVKAKLESLGLIVEVKEKEYMVKYDADIVAEQEPSQGEIIDKGETITLYIAKKDYVYPDFVDEECPIEEIEKFCEENEITLVKQYRKADFKDGTILSQSRKAGTNIVSGTTLTIVIAKN